MAHFTALPPDCVSDVVVHRSMNIVVVIHWFAVFLSLHIAMSIVTSVWILNAISSEAIQFHLEIVLARNNYFNWQACL